jgi:diaminopimelate decarboxylase
MAATDRPIPTGRTPPSPHFEYADGELRADGVALSTIAARFGTPSYVYSGAAIDGAYDAIDRSLGAQPHVIAYAMKANGNLAILARLARRGAAVDIVSGGELMRAMKAGFAPERILFSGVGKTDAEIEAAIGAGVRSLHAESEPEIDAIEAVASAIGRPAPLALRVNPDVDASTHPYIATGLRSSKFGVSLDVARGLLPRILKSPHLRLEGLACHVGSRVSSPDPIAAAVEITARFARECEEHGARIGTLDAGGGWPIAYGDEAAAPADHAAFGKSIAEAMRRGAGGDRGWQLAIEPGRSIVGDAGVLLTRVLFVKEQAGKRFVIVDAAMTELLRPALYDAFHAIVPVTEPARDAHASPADVVGPVCESGDFLARERPLPALRRGDLLAIRGAGAYAASMGSRYNGRPFAAEVLVDAGAAKLVRKREPLDALWREDVLD